MDRRFSKKIHQKPGENAYRTPIWHRVAPQTAVERRRSHHKGNQRGGTEPYSALEQQGVPKRDDLHGSVDTHGLTHGLHYPGLIAKLYLIDKPNSPPRIQRHPTLALKMHRSDRGC